MRFEPKPDNDFEQFIDTYFQRCRQVCPKLRAIAGKWTFEDLIPGMSDFDTRLIFTDDVTIEQWAQMSLDVGKVHTQLATEFPQWARKLEHLPGLNLMCAEMIDPVFYYPEFQQWTFYKGDEQILGTISNYLAKKPWGRRDELFHLKKFAAYYGPYLRWIDPPVNMGKWENKYPLHSRFMHYFTPPVQSAVSIIRKKGIPGKLDALRQAKELFPNPDVIDMILESLEMHYENRNYYIEPKLTEIEKSLEEYLHNIWIEFSNHVTLTKPDRQDSPADVKAKISTIPVDPAEQFYEGIKFSRFMKGRLLFYATQIDWFDSSHLIHVELGRMVQNFYEKPLKTFGLVKFGKDITTDEVLGKLSPDIVPRDIIDGVRRFTSTAKQPVIDGAEKAFAKKIAGVIEPINTMNELLGQHLKEHFLGKNI
ncbi:MAG: hypothetical protein ABIG61_16495 [Planctomycetota bacterium]